MRTTHRSRPLLVPLAVVACLACGAGSPHAVAEPRKHAGAGADEPLFHAELKDDAAVARAIREHYTKFEYRIPMRDGVHLFTSVYAPKDRSRTYPILLLRTPYGVAPYGADNYPTPADPRAVRNFAPSAGFVADGFIFVRQDVRGRMMSEGTFVDVRPHATGGGKTSVDESTDAWDTIDWLVKNVPNNNGRVGAWGISYPGFYAAQAAVNAHPALKAVSPQAPVTEWFLGDDFHHNGAFFFADAYDFYSNFGRPRPKPTTKTKWNVDHDGADIYDYFLSLGTLAKATSELETPIPFWNELLSHPNRDDWWKARDPRPWYKDAKPAIMTVGGWFDAEDLFGALATYRSYEKQSPGAHNALVMGPWSHGGWARHEGDRLGDVTFGQKTSLFYREHIERPFFDQHLKGRAPAEPLPEAYVFETGTNVWQRFPTWPPADAKPRTFFFHEAHGLGLAPPSAPRSCAAASVTPSRSPRRSSPASPPS
jgi:putative CocE/NonD family hydrolase